MGRRIAERVGGKEGSMEKRARDEENEGLKKGEVSKDGGATGGCGWKRTQLDWGISRKAD